MSKLIINGGHALNGSVRVHGAKNSALPILSAAILSDRETVIHNCPRLTDVDAAIRILEYLGCRVMREGDSVCVDPRTLTGCEIPRELMQEMRSSVIFLGAIFARCSRAVLSMPGGCELGPRPIDMHLDALRSLGAVIVEEEDNITCSAGHRHGGRIELKFPSVGATENAMLAATGCSEKVVISNAAREPEIWDLQNYLRSLGYNVSGGGSPEITVDGRLPEKRGEHTVIPDRIVASTFMAAAAAAGGDVLLRNVIPAHFSPVTNAFRELGCDIEEGGDYVRIRRTGRLRAIGPVITQPYPGFPTDAQPVLMAAALKAEGRTVFEERIFEDRYRYVPELRRMGAEISVEGHVAVVQGVEKLCGAEVASTDLRGGAALVVAGLSAEGTVMVTQLQHLDRGYEGLESSLRALGADIIRVDTAAGGEAKWPTEDTKEKDAARCLPS